MAATTRGNRQKDGAKPRIIRPMSHMEVYHSHMHLMRIHCGTVVTCRYTLPAHLSQGGSVSVIQDAFHHALAQTVLEHPLLQVAIFKEKSPRPCWIELDSIDLKWHVEWENVPSSDDYNARFHEITMRQVDTWFVELETRPGWRMSVVYPEHGMGHLDVVFSWNHALFDGIGGKIFHHSLLRHLNEPVANNDASSPSQTVLQLPSAAARFPPRPEKLRKFPLTVGYTLKTLWGEMRPPFLAAKDARYSTWSPIRSIPFRSEYRAFSIDDGTLQRVLGACREHKTTVTGLLHAIPLASLALQLAGQDVDQFYAMTAIDLRRFMASKPKAYPWLEPQKTMDNEILTSGHYFDAGLVADVRRKCQGMTSEQDTMASLEDLVWSVAARTRRQLEASLQGDCKNEMVGLMKFVRDWRTEMAKMQKKPRVGAWGVSNLGAIDGGDGAAWSIDRAVFQVSAEVGSPVFYVTAVSVKGKELSLVLNWMAGTVDEAIAERLARDLEAWMRYLGEQPRA